MIEKNKKWLKKVEEIIRNHIGEQHISVAFLAKKFHVSERQFRRRVQQTGGCTPLKFIREIRLIMAFELHEQEDPQSVKEICANLGVVNRPYFKKLYFKRFGKELEDWK